MNKIFPILILFICISSVRGNESGVNVVIQPQIFDLIAKDKAAGNAWLFYAYALGMCEDPSNPSFDCEITSRKAAVEKWESAVKDTKNTKDRYFSELSKVKHAGFIAEYVKHFLYRERWGEINAPKYQEFLEWKEKNIPLHAVETKLYAKYE